MFSVMAYYYLNYSTKEQKIQQETCSSLEANGRKIKIYFANGKKYVTL